MSLSEGNAQESKRDMTIKFAVRLARRVELEVTSKRDA
jgi:hypothetical protein